MELFLGLLITIIAGFGWGSFATMAIYRIPKGMPWIGDKPRCFLCQHELGLLDYFSVFSYFLWKGQCRYCKGHYECALAYFLTEFLMTLGFVLCYLQLGFGDLFVVVTGLVITLVIIGVIEAEHRIIPAKLLIALLVIGVAYRTFVDQTFYGVIYGAFLGAITGVTLRWVYFVVFRHDKTTGTDFLRWQHHDRFVGEGFDYVKMLAVSGIWLDSTFFAIFIVVLLLLTFLWRLIHPRSWRPGAIMAGLLTVMVLYRHPLTNIFNQYF